jgi:hypothetical protein
LCRLWSEIDESTRRGAELMPVDDMLRVSPSLSPSLSLFDGGSFA